MSYDVSHVSLGCGAELAVLHLPQRRAMAMEIRVIAGFSHEPSDRLGIAHLVEATLDKGTESFDGRALSDAFDEIGASHGGWGGREAAGFTSLCLPEFFDRNVELHAEYLTRPTFPQDSCEVAVELARQDLLSLEDDPQGLADKWIARQAYGPILGRYVGGEKDTLDQITRDDFVSFWRDNYCAGRMQIAVAGPLDAEFVARALDKHFAGFGSSVASHRDGFDVAFSPVTKHYPRQTEQQQIVVALRGVPLGDARQPAQRILIGVLSGGMSSRLFTEVREKQGLVYWVSAWREHPRNSGMLFVGASTTPKRCHKTYETILRELDRVGRDVTAEEIRRALTGIAVRQEIRGDVTRVQCTQLADDLFHYGRPVPWIEKLAQLEAVTVDDVQAFCNSCLVDAEFSVVTLGPRDLEAASAANSVLVEDAPPE